MGFFLPRHARHFRRHLNQLTAFYQSGQLEVRADSVSVCSPSMPPSVPLHHFAHVVSPLKTSSLVRRQVAVDSAGPFTLDTVADAVARLHSGKSAGKVVVQACVRPCVARSVADAVPAERERRSACGEAFVGVASKQTGKTPVTLASAEFCSYILAILLAQVAAELPPRDPPAETAAGRVALSRQSTGAEMAAAPCASSSQAEEDCGQGGAWAAGRTTVVGAGVGPLSRL